MITRSPDTTAEAERVQLEALRALSVRQRVAQVDELNALIEALVLADLRRRHPDAREPQLRAWLSRRRYPVPALVEEEVSGSSTPEVSS